MKKLLSLLLIVMLLFCSVASAEQETTKATATAQGYGGDLVVEAEVKGDKIIAITILSNTETPEVGGNAVRMLPERIIENQSVAIDGIAGCTISSKAIIAAAKDALVAAGLSEELATKPVEKKDNSNAETVKHSTDVVIIGTGGAGMSAAVEALRGGASVIVVDKMPTTGGNTKAAGSSLNTANKETQKNYQMSASANETIEGILALEPKNDLMASWQETLKAEYEAYKAEGATYLFDSPSLHKLQTYKDGDYVGNPEIIDVLCSNSLNAYNFLSELGAKWTPDVTTVVGATWQRSHVPTKDFGAAGASFVVPQENFVRENGGTILVDHKAEHLIYEEGRVKGITGHMTDGTPFEITASKGVIIATGGFAANVEMRQKYNTMWATLDESVRTTNGPFSTGDGIAMATEIGANVVGMEWIQMVPTEYPRSVTATTTNTIMFNMEGKRFVREDGRRDEMSMAILEQGTNNAKRLYDGHTIVDLLGGVSNMTSIPIEDMVDDEYLFKADTIEELAIKMGIDPETLVATVEDYNAHVLSGKTDSMGRTQFDKPLTKAPFYASTMEVKVHHTMGGIEINTNAEVLDINGNVIPGLYAAGEVTGGVHGSNRLGGNAILDLIVYGRTAGKNAAAN